MRVLKSFALAVLLSVVAVGATAQTSEAFFSVDDFEIAAGETKKIAVSMTSEDENIYGFQVRITLPDKLTFAPVAGSVSRPKYAALNYDRAPSDEGYTITTTSNMGEIKSAMVLSKNDESLPYYGTSGVVFTFAVTADDDIEAGNYKIQFSEIEIVKDVSVPINPDDFEVNALAPAEDVELVDGVVFSQEQNKDCNKLTYTRTFNNTNWQALYIPFSMHYADWSDDFEIARLNVMHQYDDDDNGSTDRTELEVVKLKSGSTEPNTPYLIKAKSIGEKTITVKNSTLYKAKEEPFTISTWNTIFTFKGTYAGISGGEMLANGYYALGGGNLIQAEDETANLKPFRWYLSITDRNGNPKNVNEVKVMAFDDDYDEEDGIHSTSNVEDTPIYNLNGTKVINASRPGFYIKNGMKYIVR